MPPKAKRTSAKSVARSIGGDSTTFLSPMPLKEDLPIVCAKRAEPHPTLDRNRMGSSQHRLEFIDWSSETKVGRHGGFHRQQSMDFAVEIQQGPTAISGFDRNGNLDHIDAIEITPGRDDSLNDAVFQAEWISHGHDRSALSKII